MTTTHTDLVHELPEFRDAIHELKICDAHFRYLFDQYHRLAKEIHRIDTGIEAVSDAYATTVKKRRLALMDEMMEMLVEYSKPSHPAKKSA